MEEIEFNELELEEWNVNSLHHIEMGYDTLTLCNREGRDIDELTLANELARIEGIERIKSLIIHPSSRVKNLIFLSSLPSLKTLQLNGLNLRSLDGIEWFSGRFIKIDTGKNKQRNIKKIAEAHIVKLSLYWSNLGDLEAIGRCSTIRELALSNCPRLLLDGWRNVPIETLSLFDGALDELASTVHVSSLRKLTLFDCRKLERFVGDNSNVTWMVVQRCNYLDFRTIVTFRSLESIAVVGIKKELPLSAFAGLDQLRNLSFQQCKVHIDVVDIKCSATKLEKLLITGLKKDQAIKLSETNRDVLISNGVWSYKNGSPVSRY